VWDNFFFLAILPLASFLWSRGLIDSDFTRAWYLISSEVMPSMCGLINECWFSLKNFTTNRVLQYDSAK